MQQRLGLLLLTLLAARLSPAGDLVLWYPQPARNATTEALPVGNGRLGALVFGGVDQERLCVNEDSLWTGDEDPSGDYNKMGAYQTLGTVLVSLPSQTNTSDYRRELDL